MRFDKPASYSFIPPHFGEVRAARERTRIGQKQRRVVGAQARHPKQIEEAALYTVENGKITHEEFFYAM